jgi:hypothetical protein
MIEETEEHILHGGQTLTVKDGYVAHVKVEKLKATAEEVLRELLDLDRHKAKTGDILDLQRKASVALEHHKE